MNGQKNPKSHERTNPLTKCAHFPTVICCVMPPSEHGRGRAVGGTISQHASKTNAESRPDNAAVIKSYIEFVKRRRLCSLGNLRTHCPLGFPRNISASASVRLRSTEKYSIALMNCFISGNI